MKYRIDGDSVYCFSRTNIKDINDTTYFEYLKFSLDGKYETGYCNQVFIDSFKPIDRDFDINVIGWLSDKLRNENVVS
jgi:hypothetical protein